MIRISDAKLMVTALVMGCAAGLGGGVASATADETTAGGGMRAVVCPPDVRYYHHDATGNLWAASDEAGTVVWRAEVWPFGQGVPTALEPAQRFLDQPRASNIALSEGLYHLGARTYDPLSGRFLSADPLSLTQVPLESPQSFNRFSYGINNPERFSDRTGLQPVDRRAEERRSAGGQGKKEQDPIEARKVTKIPLLIFNEKGETPFSLLLDPQAARKAVLKEKPGEAPVSDEARRAVENARMQILLRLLGPGELTQELIDTAKKQSGDPRTLQAPTLTVPPKPSTSLCDCDLKSPATAGKGN